jgi:hypothetical protein
MDPISTKQNKTKQNKQTTFLHRWIGDVLESNLESVGFYKFLFFTYMEISKLEKHLLWIKINKFTNCRSFATPKRTYTMPARRENEKICRFQQKCA